MELTAQVRKSGDLWAVEVPEVPGLVIRARRLNDVVDAVAEEYVQLNGSLPKPFLVALEVDCGSWRLHRPPWPVRSKWKEMW